MNAQPRPRVLVLARELVMHWTPFYIAAFRECCDVITCGPALDQAMLEREGLGYATRWLVPNNIVTEANTLEAILALLPEGWRPELIVTIQSMGPAIRDIARASCPTAYISVDTWHDPKEYAYARAYDFAFAAQKQLVPYFVEAGIAKAHWLPLACSPAHHHPVDVIPEQDIVFIGTTFYMVNRQRVARLERLAEHFSVSVQRGAVGETYCRAVSAGRVVFNSSVAQDLNMRVFEAMAIGRPLLSNRDAAINGLTELFEEGVHFQGYDDEDLVEQARALIEDDSLRDRMAAEARAKVLQAHTYRHRIDTLLETVFTRVSPAPCALRDEPRLSAWLPIGCRRVLDIGLGMDRSRVALRRHGVEWLAGAPLGEAAVRAASYDAILAWPVGPLDIDAITCAHPLEARLPLPELFGEARRLLLPGGDLILLLSASEVETSGLALDEEPWDLWSYEQGFHLIVFHVMPTEEGACLILRLRRYTRASLDIAEEMYRRFPGGAIPREGDAAP